jgi:hypothetical protein
MKYSNILLLFAFVVATSTVYAQRVNIAMNVGNSYFLDKKASGVAAHLEVLGRIGRNNYLGIELGQRFNNSVIQYDKSAGTLYVQDYQNKPNAGPGGGLSFPSTSMRTKPNRFFGFDMGLKYLREQALTTKTSLRFGAGAYLSYRDEAEAIFVLGPATMQQFGTSKPFGPFYIPINAYNSFWDISVKPEVQYLWQVRPRLRIGARVQAQVFTKSKHTILNSGIVLMVVPGAE